MYLEQWDVLTQLLSYVDVKGAIQKLRNGHMVEGVNDFVTYRYFYFEVEGDISRNNYVAADTKFENLKNIC